MDEAEVEPFRPCNYNLNPKGRRIKRRKHDDEIYGRANDQRRDEDDPVAPTPGHK